MSNVEAGRMRPTGHSLGTTVLEYQLLIALAKVIDGVNVTGNTE